MAVRLSFDLALHVEMTPYVSAGKLSQKEADLRRLVFWGVYTTDQYVQSSTRVNKEKILTMRCRMWGFHLGRPSRINMQDVTVTKPISSDASVPDTRWPYGSPQHLANTPSLHSDLNALSRHRALLWQIMAPIGYGL